MCTLGHPAVSVPRRAEVTGNNPQTEARIQFGKGVRVMTAYLVDDFGVSYELRMLVSLPWVDRVLTPLEMVRAVRACRWRTGNTRDL